MFAETPAAFVTASRSTHAHLHSARPDAPVVAHLERAPRLAPVRDHLARVLHRTADRVAPARPVAVRRVPTHA